MEIKVLVPVAQGVEEMETITIVDVLRRAGAAVTMASVDQMTIRASRGVEFKADARIADCMDGAWDLVVVPGGIPGAENLAASSDLEILLKRQADADKYYGAICASPAVVLHSKGLVTPGKVTCHPGFVQIIDNGNTEDANVVVDNKCVTSRGGGTAMEFSLALVEILFSEETRKEVEAGLAIV